MDLQSGPLNLDSSSYHTHPFCEVQRSRKHVSRTIGWGIPNLKTAMSANRLRRPSQRDCEKKTPHWIISSRSKDQQVFAEIRLSHHTLPSERAFLISRKMPIIGEGSTEGLCQPFIISLDSLYLHMSRNPNEFTCLQDESLPNSQTRSSLLYSEPLQRLSSDFLHYNIESQWCLSLTPLWTPFSTISLQSIFPPVDSQIVDIVMSKCLIKFRFIHEQRVSA